MDNVLIQLKYGTAIIGGAFTAVLGGFDLMLKVLTWFIVLDYFTGMVAAYITKQLNSRVGFEGICKKVLLFVPVALAYSLDSLMGEEILRNLAIWFYIANEGLSILENLGKAGVGIPRPLTAALEQLKDKDHAK